MTHEDATDALLAAERRLQAAQLAGDVAELDRLVDDRVIITGPDGASATKADDLAMHRAGVLKIDKLVEEDLQLLVDGSTGVTALRAWVEGVNAGAPFATWLRYTRTWISGGTGDWRIVAAHISVVPGAP